MSDVKRYEVVGRLVTDSGATEEYPGPENLVVYALDYDDLKDLLRGYQIAQSEHNEQIAKMVDKRRHALDRLREAEHERDEWKRRAESAERTVNLCYGVQRDLRAECDLLREHLLDTTSRAETATAAYFADDPMPETYEKMCELSAEAAGNRELLTQARRPR